MSSNHFDIRSFWKLLVASCVCVWLKLERAFSTRSSHTEVFISSTKNVLSSTWKLVEKPSKRIETRGKVSIKLHFN